MDTNHQIGVQVALVSLLGVRLKRTNVLDFSHDDITEEFFCPTTDLQDPHQSLGNFVLGERRGGEGREGGGGREGGRRGEGGWGGGEEGGGREGREEGERREGREEGERREGGR